MTVARSEIFPSAIRPSSRPPVEELHHQEAIAAPARRSAGGRTPPRRRQLPVMEFLDGQDLEDRLIALGKISERDATVIAYQLLDGLGAMHDAGIIHRDLKPANVFLSRASRGEVVKILDFGVSKFAHMAEEKTSASRRPAR